MADELRAAREETAELSTKLKQMEAHRDHLLDKVRVLPLFCYLISNCVCIPQAMCNTL